MNLRMMNEAFKAKYSNALHEAIDDSDKEQLRKALVLRSMNVVANGGSIKSLEIALQEVIENFYPDHCWWEVTDCQIFQELFMNGVNPREICDMIVDQLKPEFTNESLKEDANNKGYSAETLEFERKPELEKDGKWAIDETVVRAYHVKGSGWNRISSIDASVHYFDDYDMYGISISVDGKGVNNENLTAHLEKKFPFLDPNGEGAYSLETCINKGLVPMIDYLLYQLDDDKLGNICNESLNESTSITEDHSERYRKGKYSATINTDRFEDPSFEDDYLPMDFDIRKGDEIIDTVRGLKSARGRIDDLVKQDQRAMMNKWVIGTRFDDVSYFIKDGINYDTLLNMWRKDHPEDKNCDKFYTEYYSEVWYTNDIEDAHLFDSYKDAEKFYFEEEVMYLFADDGNGNLPRDYIHKVSDMLKESLMEVASNPNKKPVVVWNKNKYISEKYEQGLVESLKKCLNRLNEAQMSDEDKHDSALIKGMIDKIEKRSNARFTPEEQAMMDKYGITRNNWNKELSVDGRSLHPDYDGKQRKVYTSYDDWKGHYVQNGDPSKINYADRARKLPKRSADQISGKWTPNGYINAHTRKGQSTLQDVERNTRNAEMQEPVNDMKRHLQDRKWQQEYIDGAQDEYDKSMASAQAEYDRKMKYATDTYRRHTVDATKSRDAAQARIDKMLKRK